MESSVASNRLNDSLRYSKVHDEVSESEELTEGTHASVDVVQESKDLF